VFFWQKMVGFVGTLLGAGGPALMGFAVDGTGKRMMYSPDHLLRALAGQSSVRKGERGRAHCTY
jgi:hypothetical protein